MHLAAAPLAAPRRPALVTLPFMAPRCAGARLYLLWPYTCVLTAWCRCAKGSSSSSRRAAPPSPAYLATQLLTTYHLLALDYSTAYYLPGATLLEQARARDEARPAGATGRQAGAQIACKCWSTMVRCYRILSHHHAIMPSGHQAIMPSRLYRDPSIRRCSTRWPSASPPGRTRASTSCAPSSACESLCEGSAFCVRVWVSARVSAVKYKNNSGKKILRSAGTA